MRDGWLGELVRTRVRYGAGLGLRQVEPNMHETRPISPTLPTLVRWLATCPPSILGLPLGHLPSPHLGLVTWVGHSATWAYPLMTVSRHSVPGHSAKAAGVTLLNEIGLDPGIDHLSAMQMIDDAHRSGGKVVSFQSLCGGLPAPEAANNPLQYKFSWSPRGVLSAGMNSSRFLKDGKVRSTTALLLALSRIAHER